MNNVKKIIMPIIFTVMVLFSGITAYGFTSEKNIEFDINADGKINVFDLIVSKRFALNADETYNKEEVLKIQKFLTSEYTFDKCIISGISLIDVSKLTYNEEDKNELAETCSGIYSSIELEYDGDYPILSFKEDNFTQQLQFDKLETVDNESIKSKDIISTVTTSSNETFCIYVENEAFKLAQIISN